MTEPTSRRPLTTRDAIWVRRLSGALARARVQPNTISLASIVFGAIAGGALVGAGMAEGGFRAGLFAAAAAAIQLRLLCNLLDGLVAVEGGLRTKTGEIYNELPDRFADALIIIGAGYASLETDWGPRLGWLGAVLAVLTAYVRALGVTAGASQHFEGPMAKPHRMALLTAACLLQAALVLGNGRAELMPWALGVLCFGCVITVARRLGRILRELESR